MKFVVKPGCSFFVDGEKQREGDTITLGSGKQLKRYMHLVEPLEDEEEDEAPAEKTEEKPARRRRSAASEEKADE